MKRRWNVRWYELNLTEERCRSFFTEVAANFYAWYLEYKYDVKTRIYKHE